MNRERLQILVSRSLDAPLGASERDELARALKADPLLRSEAEDLRAAHTATESMFRQIALPADFAKRTMARLHGHQALADEVDASSESLRLPVPRKLAPTPLQVRSGRRVATIAAVASFAAAAALFVTIGAAMGVFSSKPAQPVGTESRTLATGGQGVPGIEGNNRTDPKTLSPETGEAPGSVRTPGASHHDKGIVTPSGTPGNGGAAPEQPAPVVPAPRDVVKQPEPANPANPKEAPAPVVPGTEEPQPESGPVVEEPASPNPTVEGGNTEPGGDGRSTAAGTTEAPVVGMLTVLNGRAEVLSAEGQWLAIEESTELREGARVRTSANGVAALRTSCGAFTLGKGSAARLGEQCCLVLEDGSVALDCSTGEADSYLELHSGDYVFALSAGSAVLERRRRSLEVSHALGVGTLLHNELGSVVFDVSSTLRVELDKPFDAPKVQTVMLPDWCADSRAQVVYTELELAIETRSFSAPERRYLDRSLPRSLEQLMRRPISALAAREFLTRGLENSRLDADSLCRMAGEVETAVVESPDYTPDQVCEFAGKAAFDAIDFTSWRENFYGLMRPAATTQGQPRTPTGTSGAGAKPG